MAKKIIHPLWYHPTRVMFIDDDEKVLKALMRRVDPKFPSLAYKNPNDALTYLKKSILPLEQLSKTIISDINISEGKHLFTENIAVDFRPLRANLNELNRFMFFVTVVVDKVMNKMDGLEFCQTVRSLNLPVKLVLLTGNAGADEAVAAFNDGIIDAFIRKSPDMVDEINHHLKILSFQSFCDSSIQLIGPIANKFSLLANLDFSSFCKQLFKEIDVVEYYILDSSCSYFLVTATGQTKILLIKQDEDFIDAYDIASTELTSNEETLSALKERKKFPFTFTDSYFTSDPNTWKENMVAMRKEEKLNFYYALVDLPNPVLSFEHYLEEVWEPEIK